MSAVRDEMHEFAMLSLANLRVRAFVSGSEATHDAASTLRLMAKCLPVCARRTTNTISCSVPSLPVPADDLARIEPDEDFGTAPTRGSMSNIVSSNALLTA